MSPALPSIPPIWRETLIGLEAVSLGRSDVWRGEGVPAGDGRPVLLIPGFLAGDGSLATMTQWLRRHGYRTKRAGIRSNVGCSAVTAACLEERLEELYEQTGKRVTVIGQSRGGTFARVLGVRRPDLVETVITLGSPIVGMLKVHPFVLLNVGVVGTLGTLGMRQCFSLSCLRGHCCSTFREDLVADFPQKVGFTSVYSKRDGIVDWRSCLDAAADHVEVKSSHCGMAVHPDVYRAVAGALSDPRAGEAAWRRAA